jgi:hypothetical protein
LSISDTTFSGSFDLDAGGDSICSEIPFARARVHLEHTVRSEIEPCYCRWIARQPFLHARLGYSTEKEGIDHPAQTSQNASRESRSAMSMQLVDTSAIERPSDSVTIWRYMDVAKFLDLVCGSRIFFCNGRNLRDQFEGEVPLAVLEARRQAALAQGLTGRDLEEELAVYQWTQANSMLGLALFNCWSIGDHESYALWKVYLAGQPFGVAVRSTVGRLLTSIERGGEEYPEEFFIGKVRYSEELPGDSWHRLFMLTRKMPFYQYENEVRLIILNYPGSEGGTQPPYPLDVGRYVKVDLETLIDGVVFSPFAPRHFHESLQTVLSAIAPSLANRMSASRIRER